MEKALNKLKYFTALLIVAVPTAARAAIFSAGEEVGLCLREPSNPLCSAVDCADVAFAADPRCLTEARAGAGLIGGALEGSGITQTRSFGDLVIQYINFFLPYLTLAAFVGIVYAGFIYVTAFGNDEQIGKAKKILVWSAIGIILVISSFAIVQLFTQDLVEGLAPANPEL